MIFSFDELIAKVLKGKQICPITCLEESPVVDVIAVGFENGLIAIINLLYSEVLITLDQSQDGGPVKSLTFSSDTQMDVSLLASVTESRQGGQNVVFWDLNKKMISSTLKAPHSGK